MFRREDQQERPKEEQANGTPQNDEGPQIRGVINTISGGFAGEWVTSSVRKRHLRAAKVVNSVTYKPQQASRAITFTDDDFVGTDPNQDDPMVITLM